MTQKTAKGEIDSTANENLRLWPGKEEAKKDDKCGDRGPAVGHDWYSLILLFIILSFLSVLKARPGNILAKDAYAHCPNRYQTYN